MALIRKTKIIPMKPAFSKDIPEVPERRVTVTRYVCDLCGKSFVTRCALRTCLKCNREICNACSRDEPCDNGDYAHEYQWCVRCFALYESKFKEQIAYLDSDYERREANMDTVWKAESLATPKEQKPQPKHPTIEEQIIMSECGL